MTDNEGKAWRDAHYKVPEGFRLTTWPRFLKLMDRLGVPRQLFRDLRTTEERVRIAFPRPEANVTVTVNGTEIDTGHACPEAYHYPETKAYFELLGVPWHYYVLDLVIDFAVGEFPTYMMRAALCVPNALPACETEPDPDEVVLSRQERRAA